MLLNISPRFEQRTCVKLQSCQQRPTVKTVSKLYNGRVIVGKLIPVLHLYLLCRLMPTTHNITLLIAGRRRGVSFILISLTWQFQRMLSIDTYLGVIVTLILERVVWRLSLDFMYDFWWALHNIWLGQIFFRRNLDCFIWKIMNTMAAIDKNLFPANKSPGRRKR